MVATEASALKEPKNELPAVPAVAAEPIAEAMPDEEAPTLPEEVTKLLSELLTSGFTGKLELDLKDGSILAWEKKERGRVQRLGKYAMR